MCIPLDILLIDEDNIKMVGEKLISFCIQQFLPSKDPSNRYTHIFYNEIKMKIEDFHKIKKALVTEVKNAFFFHTN